MNCSVPAETSGAKVLARPRCQEPSSLRVDAAHHGEGCLDMPRGSQLLQGSGRDSGQEEKAYYGRGPWKGTPRMSRDAYEFCLAEEAVRVG